MGHQHVLRSHINDRCKARGCFKIDGLYCNRGLNYLIIVYILCSFMLIINNYVMQNYTCTHNHTEYLVEKLRLVEHVDVIHYRTHLLLPRHSPPLFVLHPCLMSTGGGWSSHTPPLFVLTSIYYEFHICCFSLDHISEQLRLVEHCQGP